MAELTAKDLGFRLQEQDEPLDVLDLPQLYTRPSAKTLLATLADLSSEPTSWSTTPRSGTPGSRSGTASPFTRKRKVKSEGVPAYLTKIIASRLAWIANEDDKESVWEAASQRLSERSGRTAMGNIQRTFSLPLSSLESTDSDDFFDIVLHEPALTADNLGFKTWASSFLLAQRLHLMRDALPRIANDARVLELGAGTGLVGLAAAVILNAHVILTDLPEIVPNLERNAQANATVIAERGGKVDTGVLDWSRPFDFSVSDEIENADFPLILAADPIYSSDHPKLLVQAIEAHLSKAQEARVVLEMPLREAYVEERRDLRDRMTSLGFCVLEEGEEVGFDDWLTGAQTDELAEVRCWWSIWGWR